MSATLARIWRHLTANRRHHEYRSAVMERFDCPDRIQGQNGIMCRLLGGDR